MQPRPTLLFHCQHSLGMGHLIRSLTLAQAFAEKYRVVFLNGGPLPKEIDVPRGIEIVDLPALGMALDGALTNRGKKTSIHDVRRQRREMILRTVRETRPEVIFIELFPFGRKKFAVELLPLLEEARKVCKPAPVTVCSLRDILVGGRRDQAIHDVRASLLANHYFDAVLVHADERFVRLEETFKPGTPLTTPVHYTGFVVPEKEPSVAVPSSQADQPGILVSVGGGVVGGPLLRLAIEAHRQLAPSGKLPMTLVAGPFLPEREWQEIEWTVAQSQGVTLKRFVPDLQAEMRAAAVSISQCGYNTTMDILKTGVRSVIVPFYLEGEDEQLNRARRLEAMGVVKLIEPEQTNAKSLAEAIRAALKNEPAPANVQLDGARKSLTIIDELQALRKTQNRANRNGAYLENWLYPVRQALDDARDRVLFFFRDDDIGWHDQRLFQLLSLIEHFALPLDMAAIPTALSTDLIKKLRPRLEAAPDRLGVHQHGFKHANHQIDGRKCEFGSARSFAQQYDDIRNGQALLAGHFGDLLQPIFTPPWNRCTEDTAACLRELGIEILSREHRAAPFHLPGLQELPVHLDWFAKSKGVPHTREQISRQLADLIRAGTPVGVMFHHAEMDENEQAVASELLFLLATHGNAKCRSMRYIASKKQELMAA